MFGVQLAVGAHAADGELSGRDLVGVHVRCLPVDSTSPLVNDHLILAPLLPDISSLHMNILADDMWHVDGRRQGCHGVPAGG